jgi:hypothetical protein
LASTGAFGTTAPAGSDTVPVITPVCAIANPAQRSNAHVIDKDRMNSPFSTQQAETPNQEYACG